MINFSAKISSIASTSTVGTGSLANSTSNANYATSAAISASFANSQSSSSNTVQQEYSMTVMVRAVQTDMPAGTAKLLDLLAAAIF